MSGERIRPLLRLLESADRPLSLGNVGLVFREYVEALRHASRAEQRLLFAEIRRAVEAFGDGLTVRERLALRELLSNAAERSPLDAERHALLARLETLPTRVRLEVQGRANVLLVSSQEFEGRPFGVVQPLDVLCEPGGDRIVLEHAADDDAVFKGFQQAIWAAKQCLLRVAGDAAIPERFVGATVRGILPYVPNALPVAGPSIGLGAAVAAVSTFLGRPVAPEIAFTGWVDPQGRVHSVGALREKITAAFDKGIREVFVPAQEAEDLSAALQSSIEIHRVESLDEVIRRLFDVHPPSPRESLQLREIEGERRRVLFSCVGKADPFGRYLDRDRRPVEREVQEEGPILAVCRALRPDAAAIFYTSRGPFNDYSEQACAVAASLEDAGCRAMTAPLTSVSDPSDYSEIVPALSAAAANAIHTLGHDDFDLFVNLSSGSPQMETTWHLLRDIGRHPTRLLQVRESRFVTPGESRVREVPRQIDVRRKAET